MPACEFHVYWSRLRDTLHTARKIVRAARRHLHLTGWSIRVAEMPASDHEADSDNLACVTFPAHQCALIHLSPELGGSDLSKLGPIVAHELLHILVRPMTEHVEGTDYEKALHTEEERLCNNLEAVLWAALSSKI